MYGCLSQPDVHDKLSTIQKDINKFNRFALPMNNLILPTVATKVAVIAGGLDKEDTFKDAMRVREGRAKLTVEVCEMYRKTQGATSGPLHILVKIVSDPMYIEVVSSLKADGYAEEDYLMGIEDVFDVIREGFVAAIERKVGAAAVDEPLMNAGVVSLADFDELAPAPAAAPPATLDPYPASMHLYDGGGTLALGSSYHDGSTSSRRSATSAADAEHRRADARRDAHRGGDRRGGRGGARGGPFRACGKAPGRGGGARRRSPPWRCQGPPRQALAYLPREQHHATPLLPTGAPRRRPGAARSPHRRERAP